jgi:hypothetical protein
MPRRFQSRSRSACDSFDSQNPSDKATSCFVSSARTPIIRVERELEQQDHIEEAVPTLATPDEVSITL